VPPISRRGIIAAVPDIQGHPARDAAPLATIAGTANGLFPADILDTLDAEWAQCPSTSKTPTS
jgi:hypothetical protein